MHNNAEIILWIQTYKQYFISIITNAVFGRSIVVYGTGAQSGEAIGCPNQSPYGN